MKKNNQLKQNTIATLFNKDKSVISRLLAMLTPSLLPLVKEGVLKSAEDCSLFKGLSETQRNYLVEQSRLTGHPIKTLDLRISKKETSEDSRNESEPKRSTEMPTSENSSTKKIKLQLSPLSFSRLLSNIKHETAEQIEIKIPDGLAEQLIANLGGVKPVKTGEYSAVIKQLLENALQENRSQY